MLALLLLAAPELSTDLRPVDGHLLELGRPMEVVFTVRHSGPGVVVWPEQTPLPEDVDLEGRRLERAEDAGALHDRLVLTVVPFVAGPVAIGPMTARLAGRELEVPAARFHVRSSLPEGALSSTLSADRLEALMADDPSPPVPRRIAWGRVAAAAGGLVTLALLVVWMRRQRPAAPAPPDDPLEVALARLYEVEARMRARPGDVEAHYRALSELLRRFCSSAFALDAAAMDRAELGQALVQRGVAAPEVLDLVEDAEWVRFARHAPGPEQGLEVAGQLGQWMRSAAASSAPSSPSPSEHRPAPAALPSAPRELPPSPGPTEDEP